MKRFLMFSVSVLCLAVAVLIGFHVGSQRAEAQTEAALLNLSIIDGYPPDHYVMLDNGDLYYRQFSDTEKTYQVETAIYCGNFFDGSDVVGTEQSTWSNIKQQE